MIAEEALKLAPSSTWASHAVLGFRCAQGDWSGALAILDNNLASGLIDKAAYRRQRGVLLTARALELENLDRDLSRESAMEAVKLAPTLVPAAVLAAKYESEAHQVRRAMRIVEAAWLAHPHPDLADAYAHVDSAIPRGSGWCGSRRWLRRRPAISKARWRWRAPRSTPSEFARARAALAPLIAAPTQRVALLMAEIERTEHGDSGRARAWTLRAVRARHDPVWTADGYVSDRWRPVSPVTGPARRLPVADADGGAAVGQGRRDRGQGVQRGDNGERPAPRRAAARACRRNRCRLSRRPRRRRITRRLHHRQSPRWPNRPRAVPPQPGLLRPKPHSSPPRRCSGNARTCPGPAPRPFRR